MKVKKAISPVVATALLLVVAVVAVVEFQNWFQTYQSDILVNTEQKSFNDLDNTGIDKVIGSTLYFINNKNENLSILNVFLSGLNCRIQTNLSLGINKLNLQNCINGVNTQSGEIVVHTENKLYSKKLFLPNIEIKSIPEPANQAGYLLNTFSSKFTNENVDLEGTKSQKFQWYLWDLFYKQANKSQFIINQDNTITMTNATAYNGQLVTAVKTDNNGNFTGFAFGGGAYIEAEIKFNPNDVMIATDGYPAFWVLPVERNINEGAGQWIGEEVGYMNYVEIDILEYMRGGHYDAYGGKGYSGNLHNFYGVYGVTCPGLCRTSISYSDTIRPMPLDTEINEYHTYGFLWIPATETTNGSAKYYFDRKQVGIETTWELYEDQSPTPVSQPWKFGILDRQHMFLILGTGDDQPMSVRSVNVWQRSNEYNIVN